MKPVMFCRKSSGMPARRAELDEVRRLERRLGEQHAVVGDDADRVAVERARSPVTSVGAVARLELGEAAAVDQPRDHLADVVGLARVARDDAVDLGRIVRGLLRRGARSRARGRRGRRGSRRSPARSRSASRVVVARWSATPEMRVCTSPPPSSSAVTSSPVAAFTSGGPAEEDRALLWRRSRSRRTSPARRRRPRCTIP